MFFILFLQQCTSQFIAHHVLKGCRGRAGRFLLLWIDGTVRILPTRQEVTPVSIVQQSFDPSQQPSRCNVFGKPTLPLPRETWIVSWYIAWYKVSADDPRRHNKSSPALILPYREARTASSPPNSLGRYLLPRADGILRTHF